MKDYIRQYQLLNAANTGKEKPPSANLKNTPRRDPKATVHITVKRSRTRRSTRYTRNTNTMQPPNPDERIVTLLPMPEALKNTDIAIRTDQPLVNGRQLHLQPYAGKGREPDLRHRLFSHLRQTD